MPLPGSIARFNKRWTNRLIEPVVRRSSGFAVVHHVGRRSGTAYTTPIYTFDNGDSLIVALTYGPAADWFLNVQAGAGSLETGIGAGAGITAAPITSASLIDRSSAVVALPVIVRLAAAALRIRHFAMLEIDPDPNLSAGQEDGPAANRP